MEWIEARFALIPETNALRLVKMKFFIDDGSAGKIRRMFDAWARFHVLLDEKRFRGINDVCVEIYLRHAASLVFGELDFNFAQSFGVRLGYNFRNKKFSKLTVLSYRTAV